MTTSSGPLILLGADHMTQAPQTVALVAASLGLTSVVLLPTASAFTGPERSVVEALGTLGPLGIELEGLMVLTRSEADDAAMSQRITDASAIWIGGGSALHLVATLKSTATWAAITGAHALGVPVVASGAAAMAVADPMVDPRGGGLTVGLGLVTDLVVVTGVGDDGDDPEGHRLARTVALAPSVADVVALHPDAALVVDGDGRRQLGEGRIDHYRAGVELDPLG